MSDDELHRTCSEIEELADRLKQLFDAGASEDEMMPLMAKIEDANARLRPLLSESLARKRGQSPKPI